ATRAGAARSGCCTPPERPVHPPLTAAGAASSRRSTREFHPMSMRIFLLLFLYLAAALPASADVVRPLSGKISVGELRGACSSAGGSFVVHADGGGYGCMKENCD